MRYALFVAAHRIVACGVVLALCLALASEPGRTETPPEYVGPGVCADCHKGQVDLWRSSHHAQAMREATEATVLGDFNGATLEHFGVTTTFSRSGGKFQVRTDGPDGTLHDYEISYTFGVFPLQQYLIAMPGGRFQALGAAWDSRPKDQGGQRWFHLYEDQKPAPGNRLHWTGRDQTWNYMCADCHSTSLKKNYDLSTDTYATTWSEVDVSCESCHGPASNHVAWAKVRAGEVSDKSAMAAREPPRFGLTNWLKATDNGHWEMNPETGIAKRTEPLVSAELDTCAACHSRRRVIAADAAPGAKLLDSHAPAYLEPGLYHADGQIDGEVFEFGSFVQSRMYHAGVTCSDCHEPHSLALRAEANALCGQCHLPVKYDAVEHHHHKPGSGGAQCVNCHMPAKTYMGVDERRDHSFRVPRPDLSTSLNAPNACTQCHVDKPADWAARSVAAWYPRGRQTTPHFGTALHAGRIGAPGAERALNRLIADRKMPAIARASALLLLPRYPSAASSSAIQSAITDPDPLVRAAAPRALAGSPSPAIVQSLATLVADPIRAVRVEAARALAGTDPQSLSLDQRTALAAATLELVAAEMTDADRPEAHLNLGLLDVRRQRPAEAEAEYRTALRLDPSFVPAMVNLADLARIRGMDEQGAGLLREAMAVEPGNAAVRHSLGLLLVRQRNYPEALALFRRATELEPDNVRYSFVYAIALNTAGSYRQAIDELERASRRHPGDSDVMLALVSITRDKGDLVAALFYARQLANRYPADMRFRAIVRDLESRQVR